MADEIAIVVRAEDQFSSVLGNFGNILTGIKSGIDLVAGAFNAAVGFVTPFVESASEGEQAVANLNATLASMGDVTGLTSEQLQGLASGLQEVTRFSDETILNGEAMLLTFGNIGGDVFPRATEAMVDLAAKFGSVDQASVMLGKALNDPIAGVSALRRVGVQLSDQQTEAIKKFMEVGDIASAQAIILGELERQVGGLAEAYGDTFAGKLDIFKNRIDEIRETIGQGLLPVLSTLMDFVMPLVPVFEALGEHLKTVFLTLNVGLTEGNWMFFFGALERLDNFVGDLFQKIADGINGFVSSGGLDRLVDSFVDFLNGIGTGTGFQSAMLTAAGNILRALANAFSNINWGAIFDAFDAAMVRLIDNIDWNSLGDRFGQAITNMLSGNIELRFSQIAPAVGRAISNFLIGAMGYVSWEQLGQAIMNGLNQLDLNAQQWVDDHIINPIKAALGISSPSGVFYSIGQNIILGLINGFLGMAAPLITAVMSIVNAVMEVFQPVLDIFGIDTGSGTMGGVGGSHEPAGGGGTTGGGTGGGVPAGGTSGQVTNNYYGPVYFQGGVEPGTYYDCPSPNPLLTASQGGLVTVSLG